MRLLLLAITFFPMITLAQGGACPNYVAGNFEIGYFIDTDGPPAATSAAVATIRVYDVSTGALFGTYSVSSGSTIQNTTSDTGCQWIAYVGESDPGTFSGPNVVELEANTLYRIDIVGLGDARSFYYSLARNLSPVDQDIFSPRLDTGNEPDLVIEHNDDGVFAIPTELAALTRTNPSGPVGVKHVDEFFGASDAFDGDWVLPYDAATICASSDLARTCDSGPPPADDDYNFMFLATTPYVGGTETLPIQLVTSGLKDWSVPSNRDYDWSSADVSEIRFRRGVRIGGDLDVTGISFRSNSTLGWFGLFFLPGSTGTLDSVTIREVGRSAPRHSVAVQSAVVDVIDSFILDAECCDTAGIRVTGLNSSAFVSDTEISGMTGAGVLVTGSGAASLRDNRIFDNVKDGVVSTSGSTVRLIAQSDGGQTTMSNEIFDNSGWGARAIGGGNVIHARVDLITNNQKLSGYTHAYENGDGGIEARSGSLHNAGSSFEYARDNWFEDNGPAGNPQYNDGTGPDAASKGMGADMPARCNWWGQEANPDILVTGGAYLDVTPILDDEPTGSPTTCQPSSANLMVSGGADVSPLVSVHEAMDSRQAPIALALIAEVLAKDPGGARAATALRAATTIATDDRDEAAQVTALALLTREATGLREEHRAWAYRGLVLAATHAQDHRAVLASAAELVRFDDDPTNLLLAYSGRAYALAHLGDTDGAWAAVAAASERAAEEDRVAVDALREDVAWITETDAPVEAEASAAPAPVLTTTSGTEGFDALYPNPGSGGVTIGFVLADGSDVRLSVYDVLGREVAVLADARLDAGSHRATLDAQPLARGAYVVRLAVEGAAAYTRVLTVTR